MPRATDHMIAELRAMRLDENTVDEFLDLAGQIVDRADPRSIAPLLLLVDDDCDLEGVMNHFLDLLEALPQDMYVRELLGILPAFHQHSPMLATDEIKKRLWSPSPVFDDFVALAAAAAPESKACLRSMLETIREETPALARPAERALAAL
jgi:hypothetical protein